MFHPLQEEDSNQTYNSLIDKLNIVFIVRFFNYSIQKSALKEKRYPISVALERGLNVSMKASIQPASDRVTDIGELLSLRASVLEIKNRAYSLFEGVCLRN